MRNFRIAVAATVALQAISQAALAQTPVTPTQVQATPAITPTPAATTTLPLPTETLQPVASPTTVLPNTAPAVVAPPAPSAVTTPAAGTTTQAPVAASGTAVVPSPTTQAQQNQAAVQAILGEQVAKVAPPVMNAQDLLTQGVVVTPRAKEVVIVKKNASANTDRAVYAAADRSFSDGQYTTAIELYDRILRRSPSNKTALYGKALALHKSGRTDEALQAYERLSLLDPTNVNATANYMSLLRQKDPQRALNRLQNLEQTYPNRPALQGQIGMVYAGMNDTPDAIRAFSRAAALDPSNPVYPYNLGVLYDRLGNDKKAAEHYTSALETAGDSRDQAKNIPQETIRERLRVLSY